MSPAPSLDELDLASASTAIQARQISPVELTRAVLERINASELNAFLRVDHDTSQQSAADLERRLLRGDYLGPLHGIPISIKDSICDTAGPTTAGSPSLRSWTSATDAGVVRALKAAGAVILGKTHLYQLAYGAHHAEFGEVRNPWDPGRATGGSSSGSAAATAAGLGFGSIGTDTGGSIRIPAALCGVVGLKPTFATMSTSGVFPLSDRLDHVGPISRTARGAAILLAAASGVAAPRSIADLERLMPVRRRPTLGVWRPSTTDPIEPAVAQAVRAAIETFAGLGAEVREVELPPLTQARTVVGILSSVDAAERYRSALHGDPALMNDVLRARLEVAEFLPATAYVRALRQRALMSDAMDRLMADLDAIVLPAMPMTSYPLGQRTVEIHGRMLPIPEVSNLYFSLANVTGHPAVVVPCGFEDDLPMAIQLIGKRSADMALLALADEYQRATMWHTRRPPRR